MLLTLLHTRAGKPSGGRGRSRKAAVVFVVRGLFLAEEVELGHSQPDRSPLNDGCAVSPARCGSSGASTSWHR
jgi:hypothetical protein